MTSPTLMSFSSPLKPRFGVSLYRESPPFETILSKNASLFGDQVEFKFKDPVTGEDIGYMNVLERTKTGIAEIQDICIFKPREGYATKVLQGYIKRCKEKGFKKITLFDTSRDPITNRPSGIYLAAGFQPGSANFLVLNL